MRPARKQLPRGTGKPATAVDVMADKALRAHQSGDLATAESLYGQVLLLKPDHANSLHNLALIRMQREDSQAAIDLAAAAVNAQPRRALFHNTLASALHAAGRYEQAEPSWRRALELDAGLFTSWEGLGATLRSLDGFSESESALRRALQIDSSSVSAARHLCLTLAELGRFTEAEDIYRGLLDRNPLDADCAIQLALLRLSRADHAAWTEYSRSHCSREWLKVDPPVLVPLPLWEGEVLPDSGLLLYGEQGIGDEIMFASFVHSSAQRAARTVLLCEPRLTTLFSRSFPGVHVAAKPRPGQQPLLDGTTGCTLRASLSRLPALLSVSDADFSGKPYLHADADAVQSWRQRLATLGPGMKVGLSWRGGNNNATRASRSLSLGSFLPLSGLPGVHFVNVQYGKHDEEIAAFNSRATSALTSFDDVDPLRDMDGFAALLSALDLVISVDNSTVHLAGALGIQTWMLCPFNANWRWMRLGDHNPWYGSVRLFRQPAAGQAGWGPVLENIRQALPGQGPAAALPPPPSATPVATVLANRTSVLLVNDTTYWSHWGSNVSSLALQERLRAGGQTVDALPATSLQRLSPLPANAAELDDIGLFTRFCKRHGPLVQRMSAAGRVLLTGGESLCGPGQNTRALLYVAWIARHFLRKPTAFVNYSCTAAAPEDFQFDEVQSRVYGAMDYIVVRDAGSRDYMSSLGVQSTLAFDCLPLFLHPTREADVHGREQRIVIAGSDVADAALPDLLASLADHALSMGYQVDLLTGSSAFPGAIDEKLLSALHARLRGRCRIVAATSERQWLKTIAGARLLVSGHLHDCIAAACLGTAFVTAGNSPEITGLMETLDLRPNAISLPAGDPKLAASRLNALLQDSAPALVSAERLARLRELAGRNFDDARVVAPGTIRVS